MSRLYERRAQAFDSASVAILGEVYAQGSPLRAVDEKQVRALADGGEVLDGFAPTVVRVSAVTATTDRADIRLLDRWPDYQVVEAAASGPPHRRSISGRGTAEVHVVVVRTPEGWRISSAERSS